MQKILLFSVSLTAVLLAPLCAMAQWRMPLQMELRVPFAPTAYPSAGRTFLTYELYVTNFSGSAMELRRIEVLDAGTPTGKSLAAFEGPQIDSMLHVVRAPDSVKDPGPRRVNAGTTAVVYVEVALDAEAGLPERLKHRVFTADDSVEGATAVTNPTKLKILASPVRGMHWHAYDGPSNDAENHHRRGMLALGGRTSISRRFATDWFLTKGAIYKWHEGDAHELRSYHGYGQPVFAVASGTVVMARDGMPENVPGPVENFRRAVPLTLDTATGNMVILDVGDGQFAHYYHLQPGSLRVKTGDRVGSGTPLARIGLSGDPNVPHLHFELTTSALPLVGEGLPYVIDRYRVKTPENTWKPVARELPVRNMLVSFDPEGSGRW